MKRPRAWLSLLVALGFGIGPGCASRRDNIRAIPSPPADSEGSPLFMGLMQDLADSLNNPEGRHR